MSKAIDQYLSHYAENEIEELAALMRLVGNKIRFKKVIAVPVFAENFDFIDDFTSKPFTNTLIIVVLNTPDRPLTKQEQKLSLAFIKQVQSFSVISNTDTMALHKLFNNNALLLINRHFLTTAIPIHQGVGLARKIGCDCAAYLIHHRQVESAIIHSTDADAKLPARYFSATQDQSAAAYLYHFSHEHDRYTAHYLAGVLYEFSLHYYVAGLRHCASPYSFHTIGSIFAVHYKNYCAVRGFPKRSGGEDFYLLNKLIKTGPVVQLSEEVKLSARVSMRVPFGTGPGIAKLASFDSPIKESQFYHPDSFEYLKSFLAAKDAIYSQLVCQEKPIASIFPKPISAISSCIGLNKAVQHFRKQAKSVDAFNKQFDDWFDAFKTLKFIHTAHELGLSKQPLSTILAWLASACPELVKDTEHKLEP